MAGDEVDRMIRMAGRIAIDVEPAADSLGHSRDRSGFAADEAPHVVAEHAVELGPAAPDRKFSELRETRRVPGFGDKFRSGQQRMFGDVLNQRRILQYRAIRPAPENRGKIEAETVHVHLGNEIAEAVDD